MTHTKMFTHVLLLALALAALAAPAQAADGDGDGIDDAIEAQLCGRGATQEAFNEHTQGAIGRCESFSDFQASGAVDDAVRTLSDTVGDAAPVDAIHRLLCQVESDERALDGTCTVQDGVERYVPPGIAEFTEGLQALIGPAPLICHDTSDLDAFVPAAANNADCDERSNFDELNSVVMDPQGFVAAPRCDNPLLYEDDDTDCSELIDPEALEPGDDDPYACLTGETDPQALVFAVVNNVDCDERANFDELNEVLADPQGFAGDPTRNNPLVPE